MAVLHFVHLENLSRRIAVVGAQGIAANGAVLRVPLFAGQQFGVTAAINTARELRQCICRSWQYALMKRLEGISTSFTGSARDIGLDFTAAYMRKGAREMAENIGGEAIALERCVSDQAGVADGAPCDSVDALFAKNERKTPRQKKRGVAATGPHGLMGGAKDLTGKAVFLASKDRTTLLRDTTT